MVHLGLKAPFMVGDLIAREKFSKRAIYRIVSMTEVGSGMMEVVTPVPGMTNVGAQYSFPGLHDMEHVELKGLILKRKRVLDL